MPRPYASAEKRAELVRTAKQLLHEQGFQRTTLADVAAAAKVPVGNLYYYFKSKEALAEAVIVSHEEALRERFASWRAAHSDPRLRLRCLVRRPIETADQVIRFGCPHGSLWQELGKLGPKAPLAKGAARLLTVCIEWADDEIRSVGHTPREARAIAIELVAAVQGAMLVAHTMRSHDVLEEQVRRIERWFEETV
jgi:AcrR family transcriptional regulator